ncbi:MAG: rRNA maturation RNase YbeY, partial [Parabacteroides sp.]
MAITFYAEDIELPKIDQQKITEWIKTVAQSYGKRTGEISYIFCSDEKIIDVNRQYLKHDYYTDIITFDYTNGSKISGDIFISLDTVKSNSEIFQT